MLKRIALVTTLLAGVTAGATVLAGGGSEPRASVPVCAGRAAVDLDCQLGRYDAIVRTAGIDAAFATLKRAYERTGFVRAACHPIVHAIGHAAVARYGDELRAVYARGDPFCSAGYYHGATEQIVVDVGRQRFVAAADRLCTGLDGYAHRNCAHGIGHGFLMVLGGDLPGALRTCDGLERLRERRSCYGGAFMQNVMTLSGSRYLRPGDPLYPCADLPGRHRAMCYEKQTGYALYVRHGDAGAVFALCASVDRRFRTPCFRGLGTSIAVHHLKQVFVDADRTRLTVAGCARGRGQAARSACMAGAVRALINYDRATARALALCAASDRPLRGGCRRAVRAKQSYPE